MSVLGALMTKQDMAASIFAAVSARDFYRADHRTLASAIQTLHETHKPHDYVSVTEKLRDSGELENVGGAQSVMTLALNCYSTANAEHYAKIVREKAKRREVIALCHDVSDAAYRSDGDDLTGMLSDGVERLLKSSGSASRKFVELWGPTETYIKLARERRKAGGHLGVTTGLPGLDRVTGGIYGGRVYGIAARPATGKTALLNQIAFHAARRGQPGLVCSLEMGGEELMIRALSAASGRNVSRIFHGHQEESDAAIEASVEMGDLPLWLDTDTYSIDGILGQIASHKHKHGITWAAIDHVGLIETERFNSRNDQIGHITRRLKQTAKSLQLPIIALFQLSRNSEKESRRPGLHDLRDSGNIEQDLDVAMFLHVAPSDRDALIKPVEIGVLKNRNGPSVWLGDKFQFDGAIQTFSELATGDDQ